MSDMIRKSDALEAVAGWEIPSTAIAALPAVTVGVKPLEWQFEQEDVQVANTSARHQYRIVFDHRATVGAWMWFCDGRWICCETEEAAKAAAQADYEARILAALAPQPAPDAAAMTPEVRALEKEVLRLKAKLWAIGHAAGIETKEDLMQAALDALRAGGDA